MAYLDYRWLLLHVGLPLVVPILLAIAVTMGWWSTDSGFRPNLKIIADVTPWALLTNTLTLLGSAIYALGRTRVKRRGLMLALRTALGADIGYYSILVIRRHQQDFAASFSAYSVALLIFAISVVLCYKSRKMPARTGSKRGAQRARPGGGDAEEAG